MRRINHNGDFDAWPMGHVIDSAPHMAITASMWRNMNTTPATLRYERSYVVPSYAQAGRVVPQSMKITCTGASNLSDTQIGGVVAFHEGQDWRTLHGSAAAESLWVMSSVPGPYYCGLRTGKAPFKTLPMRYEIAQANVWQRVELLLPPAPLEGGWTFHNDVGFAVWFFFGFGSMFHATPGEWSDGGLGGGSDQVNWFGTQGATFHLASVQVEKDAVTPFESRPYEDEQRARRYIQSSFERGVRPESGTGVVSGSALFHAPRAGEAWQAGAVHRFDQPMRSSDYTVTTFNPVAANARVRDYNAGADCGPSWIDNKTTDGFRVSVQGAPTTQIGNTLAYHWLADASVPTQ